MDRAKTRISVYMLLIALASCAKSGSQSSTVPASNAVPPLDSIKSASMLLPLEKQLCIPLNAQVAAQRSLDQQYAEMFAQGVAVFNKVRPVTAWLEQNVDNDARFTAENVQRGNGFEDYTGHFLDDTTISKIKWGYKEQNVGWSGQINIDIHGCSSSASTITILDATPDPGNPKLISLTYKVTEAPTIFAEKIKGLMSVAPPGFFQADSPSSRAGEHRSHARFLDATGWRIEDVDGAPITYN